MALPSLGEAYSLLADAVCCHLPLLNAGSRVGIVNDTSSLV